jgi:hypothetical protein
VTGTTTYTFHIGGETRFVPIRWRRACSLSMVEVQAADRLVPCASRGLLLGLTSDILANVAVGRTPANRLLVLYVTSGPRELVAPIVVVVVALNKSGPSDT